MGSNTPEIARFVASISKTRKAEKVALRTAQIEQLICSRSGVTDPTGRHRMKSERGTLRTWRRMSTRLLARTARHFTFEAVVPARFRLMHSEVVPAKVSIDAPPGQNIQDRPSSDNGNSVELRPVDRFL